MTVSREVFEQVMWERDLAIKQLEDLGYGLGEKPKASVTPKTGHWIRITNGAMREKYICSKCGRQIEDDGVEGLLPIKYPYCHCGAKMEVNNG